MKQYFFPAIKLTLLSLILLSGVYTLVLLGIGKLLPGNGEAKKVSYNSKTFYANIAQNFSEDRYFWSRPSAVDYNAAGSAGSNKGPINPDYLHTVQARIDTFLAHNPGVDKKNIPVDMVTASGSGLDPDISPEAAYVQEKRIASARGIPEQEVKNLIEKHIDKPLLGMFGPEKVNVLELNIALDKQKK
jgi:K+-transporting ATPase ATPase C chain